MKKKAGKLTLSRETVLLLEDPNELARVVTGATRTPGCTVNTYICSGCRPCL